MRQPAWRRCALLLVVALVVPLRAQGPSGAPPPFVLGRVNVVDVADGTVMRDADVTVRDGRIASVTASTARPADGIRRIDAAGKFLIPGLAEMHAHWYDERYLGLFIANGVTTVRLMWGSPMHAAWRARIDGGELLGPRFVIAGPIVDGPNPVWPGSTVVADAAAGRSVVEKMKADGYDFVKVYNRVPRDAYFAIAGTAKAIGIPFAGHVPNAVSAGEASDAGQKSIEHGNGVLIAASSDEARLRADLIRAFSGGEASQGIDAARRAEFRRINEAVLATYDAPKAAALFATFVKNGTWMCPTLTVLRSMASLDDERFTSDPRLKYMPRGTREMWNPGNDPRNATKTPADYALERRMFRKQVEVVGAMNKAGVPIVAGTDVLNPFTFPGFSLHDELGLLVEAGLTPAQALRAATLNAARFLGTEATSGSVAAGRHADLVLLDDNPLTDIANTRRIAAVVARGRYLDRAALDGLLAQAEKLSIVPAQR